MSTTANPIEQYHLYVGRLQPIPEEVKYSFYSSKRGYLFLFTDKEPKGFAKLEPKHYTELSTTERAWLDNCSSEVLLNSIKSMDAPERDRMALEWFFEEAERRLKAIREELEKGYSNERERNGTERQVP